MSCKQPIMNWAANSKYQSPCVAAQLVGNSCGYAYGPIIPLSPSDSSFVPAGSNATQCTCSWASYNLFSACMLCYYDKPNFVSWDNWTINCGGLTSTTYFPSGITPLSNTTIPLFAQSNPSSTYQNGIFDETTASGIAVGPNSGSTGNSSPSSTSSSSASSSSSSAPPVGTIVGGVVGGVVLLLLFCGFFLFIFCRRRRIAAKFSREMTRSHFTVEATKDITRPSGYPQTSAPMSTSPYSPVSNGMPGAPSTTSLHSFRVASPTSPAHVMPISPLSPSVPLINDAADVITPFLIQSPSRPATSRSEKSAQVTPESIPDRSMSPQSQRSRMNPPPYAPSSPTSTHVRSGSNASKRLSIRRHFRQGGGSRDTTIGSVIGNHNGSRAPRMRTTGSEDSTRSTETTASGNDSGAGRSFRTALERTTTSAASSGRGPSV